MNQYPAECHVQERSSTAGNVVYALLSVSLAAASQPSIPIADFPTVSPIQRSSTIGQNLFDNTPHSAALRWLLTLQLRDQTTSEELITAINRLNILLKDRNFEFMDAIFRHLDVTKITPEMMLAFIRTTFAARLKLSEWCQLRDHIRAELLSRRLDPDTLLRGLG